MMISALLVLTACGGPKEYVPYSMTDLCATSSRADVIVEGDLRLGDVIVSENKYRIVLAETYDQPKPFLAIGVEIGDGNNQMAQIPDNFKLEDVKILTDDGQVVTDGDRVLVYGSYRGSCLSTLTVTVDKIEAVK